MQAVDGLRRAENMVNGRAPRLLPTRYSREDEARDDRDHSSCYRVPDCNVERVVKGAAQGEHKATPGGTRQTDQQGACMEPDRCAASGEQRKGDQWRDRQRENPRIAFEAVTP